MRMLVAVLASWRASILASLQYRLDFFLTSIMSVLFGLWTVAPLVLVYEYTEQVKGFRYHEALLVMSFFLLLRGLLDAFIEPNLQGLVAKVRQGTLDFTLLKPADSQVLVSFAVIAPGRLVDLLSAVALATYCLVALGKSPTPLQWAAAGVCVLSGVSILYSLWLVAAGTAFFWVKVESLTYLFGALLDAGRWPAAVYRGWLRFVLTFVLPITLMTSMPAEALLGVLEPEGLMTSLAVALVFLAGSRWFWRRAIGHYTSASS